MNRRQILGVLAKSAIVAPVAIKALLTPEPDVLDVAMVEEMLPKEGDIDWGESLNSAILALAERVRDLEESEVYHVMWS